MSTNLRFFSSPNTKQWEANGSDDQQNSNNNEYQQTWAQGALLRPSRNVLKFQTKYILFSAQLKLIKLSIPVLDTLSFI